MTSPKTPGAGPGDTAQPSDEPAAQVRVGTAPTLATPHLHKRCPACDAVTDHQAGTCQRCGGRIELVQPTVGDANVGREIDSKFTIERELGRGGMGVVYAAKHHGLGATVALKMLAPELSGDPLVRARFRNEARAAAQVRHPNVVRVLDFGETSAGELYLAMELIEGESLATLLAREAPLAPSRAVGLITQLLEGLGEAHALGIVHRDLKPDNLLVEKRRSGAESLKVLDFGIAREQRRRITLTATGDIIGTPAYMSPEQVRGDPVDGRSDLYSVGVVLRELVTGEPLFPDCASPAELLNAHLERAVPPLGPVAAVVGDAVDEAIKRALAKRPSERFATAEAFAEALRRAQDVTGQPRDPLVSVPGPARTPPLPSPPMFASPPAPSLDRPHDAVLATIGRSGPGVVVVLGAGKSGKTRLARAFVEERRRAGRAVLATTGQAAALPRPLAVARALTLSALGARDRAQVGKRLAAQPEGERLGLGVILEDPRANELPYQVRLREAGAAFDALLRRTDADLLIDDAHAVDPPSWRLLEPILRQPGARQILLVSREALPPFSVHAALPAPPEARDERAISERGIRALTPPARALLGLLLTSEEAVPERALTQSIAAAQLEALVAELLGNGVPIERRWGIRVEGPSARFDWYRLLEPEERRAAQVVLFRIAQTRGDVAAAASLALAAWDADAVGAAPTDRLTPEEVVEALRRGGDFAQARFDEASAQRAWRAALDVVRREPVPTASLREAASAVAERLARVARYRGDVLGAEMFVREAMRLSNSPTIQVAAHRALRRVATEWGLHDRAEAEGRAAVHVARRVDDAGLLAECYAELAETLLRADVPAQAVRVLEDGLGTLLREQDATSEAMVPSVIRVLVEQATATLRLGRREAATANLREVEMVANRGACHHGCLEHLLRALALSERLGAVDLAQAFASRALELASRVGDRLAMAESLRALARLWGEGTSRGIEARSKAAELESAVGGEPSVRGRR